jgi:GNAT superfamily N-acetyltransferase/mannose-6-phosphate isomerase-like protein (cupin superfamily)
MSSLSLAGAGVRDAGASDLPAVRRVLLAAYQEYAATLPPAVFGRYLNDILDAEGRAGVGEVLVVERGGRVVGTVTYYPDASLEGFGWPAGWAGLRALGVDPGARGLGVGRALLAACLERAEAAGAPVLCLHTAEFMTAAVAIYEQAGFRRDPAYDFDATGGLALGGVRPVPILAYRLDLTGRLPAARVGEVVENPVSGERGVVRVPPTEANGHLLVADLYLRPGGRVAGEHVHPVAREAFTVVRGELAVRRGGRDLTAGPGVRTQVPPGVAHDFWNPTDEEVRVVVEAEPGDRLAQAIRHVFLAAQDGLTDAKGRLRPLHAAVVGREFGDTIRFTSPPWPLQRVIFGLLSPITRITGHRALDPAYLERDLPIVDLEPIPDEIAAVIPALAGQPTRST